MVGLIEIPTTCREQNRGRRRRTCQRAAGFSPADFGTRRLHDANWDTTAVVGYDATSGIWNVVQRYVYSPYGSLTILNADFSTPPSGTQPMTDYLYQGMSLDPVTGLYYERNRNYSPSLGVWTSQDPLRYVNGANTYQFVGSSPVGMVDPEGTIPWYYWVGAGAVDLLGGGPEDPFGDAAAGLILEDGAQAEAAATAEQAAEDAAAQAAKKLAEKAAEEALKKAIEDAKPEGQYCPASDVPGNTENSAAGNSAIQGKDLARQLTSDEQLGQALAGEGKPIAGSGARAPLRDAPRLASQYGGNPGDWAKMAGESSSIHGVQTPGGDNFETHWYQNTGTGQVVEIKTKITG
jgi:RHS repeat-associated protein